MTCSTSEVAVCCSSASREFLRARLYIVEQPHVFDRDHGLVSESLHQLDLLVGERVHDLPLEEQHANRSSFSEQRHAQHRADVSTPGYVRQFAVRVRLRIHDLNGPTCGQNLTKHSLLRPERFTLHSRPVFGGQAVACGVVVETVSCNPYGRTVCVAQSRRRLDQCIEHCLQVER